MTTATTMSRMSLWGLVAIACSVPGVSASGNPADPAGSNGARMTSAQLEKKAIRLQAIIEEKTLQAHGMIPMFVRATDYQLPRAEDYAGAYKHRHLLGKTEEEIGIAPMHVWRAWENTSADTGFYLGANAYRYRCTGDPKALAICRRTLGALKYIHDLAVQKGERGFLTKPYGGKYSNQTSGDQVQCVVVALATYRPIALPEDRAIVDELTRDFADHQIEVDYDALHGYFAHPRGKWGWEHKDWGDGLIYTPLLHLAFNSTGDPKYIREVHRWYKHCGLDKKWSPPGKTFSGSPACRMLYLPTLMMEFDPANHELWRSFMLRTFRICRTGILPDGTTYYGWHYDAQTGSVSPVNTGWGGSPTRTGRSAIFAKGCVNAQRWFPEEDMVGVARTIIEGLDEQTFRFVMPAAGDGELSPEWQVEGRLLDHDGLTGWLWAYWEGRWRGYW